MSIIEELLFFEKKNINTINKSLANVMWISVVSGPFFALLTLFGLYPMSYKYCLSLTVVCSVLALIQTISCKKNKK